MNFSSHQRKLIEDIDIALRKDSLGLINDFISILSTAATLYKTERFDIWRSELGRHQASEIPITKYGHSNACALLLSVETADKNLVCSKIYSICECLFTYSNKHEICEMQSDFHYYYDTEKSRVFKESELGIIDPDTKFSIEGYRIALKSELKALEVEFYK